MKIFRLALTVISIMGMVLCLAMGATAVYLFHVNSWKPGAFVEVTGHVIRLDREETSGRYGGGAVYYPVVRYQAGKSGPHTIRATVGSYPPHYKIGDAIRVKYKKKNPAQAMLDTAMEQSFLPGLFLGLSIIGLMFSIACLIVGWQLPRIIKWLR